MSTILNEKQENLLRLIEKKKECDKRAQEIVLKLIEPQIQPDYLLQQAIYLAPSHYEDVIEERGIAGICGWAICGNTLDSQLKNKQQKYIIRGKRVLDITQRKGFCSSRCFAKSTHFKKQLLVTPLWMREHEIEETHFEILNEDIELHGLTVDISGLKLDDKKEDITADIGSKSSSSDSEDSHKDNIDSNLT